LISFAAAAEIALTMVNRSNLQAALDEGKRSAATCRQILVVPERMLSALLLIRTASVVAAGAATLLVARRIRSDGLGLAIATVLLLAVILTVRIIARALVLRSPDAWAMALAGPTRAMMVVLSPATALMLRLSDRVRGPVVHPAEEEHIFLTEDGLRFLIHAGEEESTIEEEEKEMIASIFEFGETLVREVMIPRIDLVALPVDTSVNEALDAIIQAGFSRIPIYQDTIDNIVGLLYAKDLLGRSREGGEGPPVADLLREAYFVPETMVVDDLFRELQSRRVHMAIVVDEYGGTAGLATIEDLLEEIVGEIQDEYDTEEPLVRKISDWEYQLQARINLDDASELLRVALPPEGGDTLGGFIYSQLGRVPVVGDDITFEQVQLTVLSVDGRSVRQVRAVIGNPTAEPTD
jgi:CBS domain containing-hemolysin-like protein